MAGLTWYITAVVFRLFTVAPYNWLIPVGVGLAVVLSGPLPAKTTRPLLLVTASSLTLAIVAVVAGLATGIRTGATIRVSATIFFLPFLLGFFSWVLDKGSVRKALIIEAVVSLALAVLIIRTFHVTPPYNWLVPLAMTLGFFVLGPLKAFNGRWLIFLGTITVSVGAYCITGVVLQASAGRTLGALAVGGVATFLSSLLGQAIVSANGQVRS